jgi:transposase
MSAVESPRRLCRRCKVVCVAPIAHHGPKDVGKPRAEGSSGGGIICLTLRVLPEETMIASEEKVAALRAHRALNPRPEDVFDAWFVEGEPFFDARDLVQVKYEMLRRVRVDGQSVSHAASIFGFSRTSFYAARAAWEKEGLPGLLPRRPGPRGAHKLTGEILSFMAGLRKEQPNYPTALLVAVIRERFGVVVHPRSVERALARQDGNPPSPRPNIEGWEPQVSSAYEKLRAWAAEQRRTSDAGRPPGLALLLRRGLPATMAAWASWLPPYDEVETTRAAAGAPNPELPRDEEVVLVLSCMILSGRKEIRL